MKLEGNATRSIWLEPDGWSVGIFDQRKLPWTIERMVLRSADDAFLAIADMATRGAPLIGAAAAYGLALGLRGDAGDASLTAFYDRLITARPTAVNLRWALDRLRAKVAPLPPDARADAAWIEADAIAAEDVAINHAIGGHGLELLERLAARRAGPVNVMTHCNAGALATCGWGTATAPIFLAHARGLAVHVWVSETRPRLQGANLTAWELAQRGIPYTIVVDGAGAALMRRREVDVVFVGADRVARNGDVCNKIGTYDKALGAKDNGVPFYVALPSPTLDPSLPDGDAIPIESRAADEVLALAGRDEYGQAIRVGIAPERARALNPAFDVTPARLVTGLLTERGVATPSEAGLAALFPEKFA